MTHTAVILPWHSQKHCELLHIGKATRKPKPDFLWFCCKQSACKEFYWPQVMHDRIILHIHQAIWFMSRTANLSQHSQDFHIHNIHTNMPSISTFPAFHFIVKKLHVLLYDWSIWVSMHNSYDSKSSSKNKYFQRYHNDYFKIHVKAEHNMTHVMSQPATPFSMEFWRSWVHASQIYSNI
jgi:hypothetical protein